jgi:hypothetical protein
MNRTSFDVTIVAEITARDSERKKTFEKRKMLDITIGKQTHKKTHNKPRVLLQYQTVRTDSNCNLNIIERDTKSIPLTQYKTKHRKHNLSGNQYICCTNIPHK